MQGINKPFITFIVCIKTNNIEKGEYNYEIIAFVDLAKPIFVAIFDSVDRLKLWNGMNRIRYSRHLINSVTPLGSF